MSNFMYKRKITIDHTKIDATLTDYPVMVKLDGTNFDFTKVRSDGYDVRFYANDEATLLDYERELFDDVGEKAVIHVRVPSISSSADTDIYMYYGDATATDGQNATGVWDSNFVMVQHMGDSLVDSTGNGNNGTNYGSTVVNGLNGKARSFDGINNYINCGGSSSINLTGTSLTLQSVFKFNSLQTLERAIFGKGGQYELNTFPSTHNIRFLVATNGITGYTAGNDYLTSYNTLDYRYIAGVYNGSNINVFHLGNFLGAKTVTGNIITNASNVNIGGRLGSNIYANITVEEVRISNIARSSAWIKADDYNLRANTLLSIGVEQLNKQVIGLTLLTEPTKTTYFLNESLDLTGTTVEVEYDDLSTAVVEPTIATGFDSSYETNNQEVTITVGEYSVSFYVTIRHDYRIGQIITIKFNDDIVSDPSGNEAAFTVTGKEYKWWNGPDNNGPLLDKEYQVVSVVPHPTLDSKHIRLILDDYSRFPTVEGNLTVEYDASIGTLAGSGGAVESFVETFAPTGLVPEPNIGIHDSVTVAPASLEVDLLPIEYIDRFAEETDTITVAPATLEVELIHIDVINP